MNARVLSPAECRYVAILARRMTYQVTQAEALYHLPMKDYHEPTGLLVCQAIALLADACGTTHEEMMGVIS